MKKIWKRSLSLFLAFVMVFGMLPVSAFADETEPVIAEETSVTEPVAAEAAEIPAEETTEASIEAVTEAPVETATDPPSEAITEPTETVAAVENDPVILDTQTTSDQAVNSAAGETAASEETEPSETEPALQKKTYFSGAITDRNLLSEEEMFAGYAEHAWFGTEYALFGTSGYEQLGQDEKNVYTALKPFVEAIASGDRNSALIRIGEDLDDTYTAEAKVEFNPDNVDLNRLMCAMLSDMPYDLYWFDKEIGIAVDSYYYNSAPDVKLHYVYLAVARQYNDGTTYETFTRETGETYDLYFIPATNKTSAVTQTTAAALAVVTDVANNAQTDYDKLLAYKDWICANTDYNDNVLNGNITFSSNINPWQLIYVFDNDPSTQVVCEGYSKAFQYLCELTDFTRDSNNEEIVTCYSVTGDLVDVGAHMWNIVEIEGNHYLADITNSDAGTVGENGSLFLVGGTPDADGIYTFNTINGSTAGFQYDADTQDLWKNSGILTLSAANYTPPVSGGSTDSTMTQADFLAAVTDSANNGTIFYLDQKVTLDSSMTIPSGAQLHIIEGGSLIIPNGVTVTNEAQIQLNGGKCIVENGGTLNSTGFIQISSGIMFFAAGSGHSINGMNGPIIEEANGDTASALFLYNIMDQGSGLTVDWNRYSTVSSMIPGMYLNGVFAIREWDSVNYEWDITPINPYDLTCGDYLTVMALEDTPNPGNINYNDPNAGNIVAVISEEGHWDVSTGVSYTYNGTAYTYDIRLERPQRCAFYSEPTATNETYLGFDYTIDPDKADNSFYFIFTDQEGWSIDHSQTDPISVVYDPFEYKTVEQVTWEKVSGSDTTYKITIKPEVVQELCTNGGRFPVHVNVQATHTSGNTGNFGFGQIWCTPKNTLGFHNFYSSSTASQETQLGDTFVLDPNAEENAFYYIFTDLSGFAINDGTFAIMHNPDDTTVPDGVSWEKISDRVYKIIISQEKVADLAANGGSVPVFVEVTATDAIFNYTQTYGCGAIQCMVEGSTTGETMTQDAFKAELEANVGTNYVLSKSVTITEDMAIRMATAENPYNHSFLVNTGATLTVAKGATLSVETDFMLGGGTVVVEEGGQLVIGTEECSQTMYLWGGTLTAANQYCLDLAHCQIMIQHGSTNVLPEWITPDTMNAQFYVRSQSDWETALTLTQYRNTMIYVQCDLVIDEHTTIGNGLQVYVHAPHSLTVNDGVTLTVSSDALLCNTDNAVINNNGRILCHGTFDNYGTLNGNEVEIAVEEMDEAAFLEEISNAGSFYQLKKNVTISGNVELPEGVTVWVGDNATLTVAQGATLTVNQQLSTNNGSIIVHGTLINNRTLTLDDYGTSGSLTISSTGELQNNSYMFIGSSTLTIEGTYSAEGYGSVEFNDTKAQIIGMEKIGKENIGLMRIVTSEDALIEALVKQEGYRSQSVRLDADLTLSVNELVIPEGVSLYICYSWMSEADYKTLTIPEGTTLINNGSLCVNDHGELVLAEGATLLNNGWMDVYGRMTKYGHFEGNDIFFGNEAVMTLPEMSQAEFAAAVDAANGQVYELNNNVTLTSDMTITSEVRVNKFATLTVDGCKLTVCDNGNGDDTIYGHLIASGGTITVTGDAALDIDAGLVQVWGGGYLTLEEGANLTGVQADEIWVNMTGLDEIPVTGLEASMLGAIFNAWTTYEIEAAFAQTDTYAHIGVYPVTSNLSLEYSITIPQGDDLNLQDGITLVVPAGVTLTNDGWITIRAENRMEVLEGGALVNNDTINLDRYSQLYYYKDTLTNNGTIQGDGDLISSEMSHEDLIKALEDCDTNDCSWVHEAETTLETGVNGGILTTSFGENSDDQFFYLVEGGTIIVPKGCRLEIYNPLFVQEGGKVIVEEGGKLYVNGLLSIEGGTVYVANSECIEYGDPHRIEGRITYADNLNPYLTSTWLDNNGEGWYMNEEFHEANGLMSMEEHWRIFFLNTWDADNMDWNSTPVVPTENSEYMTITPIVDMEDQEIRWDQWEYEDYFVRVDVYGTLDQQNMNLFVNGDPFPFEIHERHTGFFRTTEFTLDSIIPGHEFVLDTQAGENVIYWLVRDTENYDIVYEEFNYRTWNDEDYSDYITGEDLIVLDNSRKDEGIYKITVDPGFVDYVQYDWKNFEIQVNMTLDYSGDDEIHEEPNNGGLWINPPELLDPAAALTIDNTDYMIFESGRIFRDVFAGYNDQGHEIWKRQETSLPDGVSYVLGEDTLILNGADLTSLELHPTVSGYDEEGNFWKVPGLPSENLTISLDGSNIIENHCNPALWIRDGMNVTITGNGSLYAKTTNYPDYRDKNGELQCFNTINVHGGSTLTIGGNATVTAELSGHGYWGNGEAATCHPISGGYNGDALVITDNATVTTVLPNGVRRYDNSGRTSQIGGYVGIQNFNTITISGGTLNTDHLNFYNGGQFNLTGGTVNFKDIGGINKFVNNEGVEMVESHYEGINMWNGAVNISGGTLNIDVTAREDETVDIAGFYGINVVNGTMDVTGGEINITANTDGWAILADCEWTEEGWVDDTGSTLNVTGGTININNADRTYHGGILVSEICSAYFGGGEIHDDYGIHRFYGETVWGDGENGGGTVLTGTAANVYTHGPGSFSMYGGQINLTGDTFEDNGETITNRAIFQANAGGTLFGGTISLTNGTYINNMSLTLEGGEIIVHNNIADMPGLENNLYFPINSGTIDITANGVAIVNGGTFHQMGGTVTATNTSGSKPVMVSSDSTLLNNGSLNLYGNGGIGLVQAYNFDLAADDIEDNESMLFVGPVDVNQNPSLNISGTQIGLYVNGPAAIMEGSNVDIQVEGEPINADRDWPMAIYVEKHTGNPDLSGDNVSTLFIDGGANVNLISRDTAGVDAMSKGIVAWYAPVEIGSETAAANVTIDAEMAVYSVSDSLDNTNFNEGIIFYDKLGGVHTLTSRDFTETEETGDYLHTLMDGDSYVGYATVGKSTAMSLDEFLAAVAEAAANNESYELTGTLIVDRDVELNGFGVTIGSGAEIIVKDGAVLTSNLNFEVSKDGKFTVEAGGRMVNQNSFIIEGTVSISDDGDYAGYVHNMPEGMLVGIYADGTDLPSVTGIPKKDCILQAKCNTEDQINYILGICGDYTETIIVPIADMVLNTMTIPEKVWLSTAPGITITVADGAFLTLNGGLSIHNSTLIVNGKLINNVGMTFNLAEVTVNGTFENNKSTFINDSSVMTVNGILNNYAPLHVGFWKNTDTEGAAGTLNINGTLNNYDYLNISPDAQITEEDGSIRDCSGVVNVNEGGVLDNTFDESTKKSGFIENHGDLNIYGTMMNGQAVAQYGSLHLYGKLDNGGNIRLYDKVTDSSNALKLVTYPDAELINNTMIGNFSRNGVITLADGTYTQGSHTYKDGTTEPGELDAYYFDDQIMAQIQGAPEGMVSIFYEGSNAEALLAASEAYNRGEGYYDRCFLRVVGDMTFPAGKELNLAPGTYLVVLNNGNNYNGSLTVEGAIFNQSYIRLYGADMTITEGGWITNKGTIETGDSGTSVTVCGLLENASTGTVDLSNAEFARFEPGVVQNNLAGGNLGSIAGIPVSEQTLFSDIADGGQARLQELIGMVQNDGYLNGFFWISKDLHITESTVLPGNVSLNVLDGAALTIDPGVVLQLDSWLVVDAGGNLNVNGTLGIMDGTVDIRGTMTLDAYGNVGMGANGVINVIESGSLINKGYFGVDGGTVNGNFDNRGTVSITWTEDHVGSVNGTFLSGADRVSLFMPFNDTFPNHDEADIAAMLAYAQEHGYSRTTVQFFRDYTFVKDFTVPQNMTFAVGAYGDEQNYKAATVTIPADLTLTIDGNVQVAKKSALVILGSVAQNATGSFYASGSCGNNAEWVLNNGILTISGSGDMLDCAKDSAPWAGYASLVTSVKIDTGITGIGDNAFGNISVDSILVPRNVASVGENAFADGVTLKVYHESAAEAYAESYGHYIVYIHELDPETGACLYCDFGLEATLKDETKTTEEKVEEVKNTDTESLKTQIENEMTQDASGASDTMDLIEDLETQVKTDSGITVDAGVAPNASENISTTFQQVSDEAIVGAVLNAKEDVSEVKLVISNPSGENEVSEDYDTDTGVVFSMTLEGVEDASSLDVPVKITLPVPAGIKDLSKLVVLHYHDGVEEVVNYTLSTGEDGKAYVSFLVSGFSDFAIVEEAEPEIEKFNLSGATMTLGNSLSINFVVNTSKLDGDGHYAKITKKYADGREDVVVTVPQEEWKVYSGSLYYFAFDGVAAKEMTDELTVVVYNRNNTAVTNTWTDSVRDYAMRALVKEEAKASPDAEKLTLYVDMMNYGAAAQTYFKGYHGDDLANNQLNETQKAYATVSITMENEQVKGEGYAGTTLTLESQIVLNFVYRNTTLEGVTHAVAAYTDHYGKAASVTIDASEFMAYNSTMTYIPVSGMAVADCGQLVTLTLYNANNEVVSTSCDSVESYISRIANANELYTMIMRFATAAYASFH